MSLWKLYEASKSLDVLTEGQVGILAQAEQEIDQHFRDFENKLNQALGQKKDGWLSWGAKALGSAIHGGDRVANLHAKNVERSGKIQAARAAGNKSAGGFLDPTVTTAWRAPVGNFISKMGEKLRPATAMEKQYKTAQEQAVVLANKIVNEFVAANKVLIAENTIPSWIEELRSKVMQSLQRAVNGIYHAVRNEPVEKPMQYPANAKGELMKKFHDLIQQYGGRDNIPQHVLHELFPLAKTGANRGKFKKDHQAIYDSAPEYRKPRVGPNDYYHPEEPMA